MTTLFAESILLAETVNIHWYLPPLLVAMSLVYSATRYESWSLILVDAVRWIFYTLTFLGSVYLLMWLITLDLPRWIYWVLGAGFLYYMFKPGPKPAAPAADSGNPTETTPAATAAPTP